MYEVIHVDGVDCRRKLSLCSSQHLSKIRRSFGLDPCRRKFIDRQEYHLIDEACLSRILKFLDRHI